VIVNDSARAAGLEIPLTTFYESWRDSEFRMTVTDASAQTVDDAYPPTGDATLDGSAPDYALLGMTLSVPEEAAEITAATDTWLETTSIETGTGSCAEWLYAPQLAADAEPATQMVDPLQQSGLSVTVDAETAAYPGLTVTPDSGNATAAEAAAYPGLVVSPEPANATALPAAPIVPEPGQSVATTPGLLVSTQPSTTDYYGNMVAAGYNDPFLGDIWRALDFGPSMGETNMPISGGPYIGDLLGQLSSAAANTGLLTPPGTVSDYSPTLGTQYLSPGELPYD